MLEGPGLRETMLLEDLRKAQTKVFGDLLSDAFLCRWFRSKV